MPACGVGWPFQLQAGRSHKVHFRPFWGAPEVLLAMEFALVCDTERARRLAAIASNCTDHLVHREPQAGLLIRVAQWARECAMH